MPVARANGGAKVKASMVPNNQWKGAYRSPDRLAPFAYRSPRSMGAGLAHKTAKCHGKSYRFKVKRRQRVASS